MPPPQLPFLGTEAIAAGVLTKHTLLNQHNRLYRDVYVPRGEELTAESRAMAAWLWSDRQVTLGGLSAAALHGSGYIDAPPTRGTVPTKRQEGERQRDNARAYRVRSRCTDHGR